MARVSPFQKRFNPQWIPIALFAVLMALIFLVFRTEAYQPTNKNHVVEFVAVGDTGSGSSAQKAIAREMFKQYQAYPYPQVLMLGDNLYPDGNVSKYGKSRFLDVYRALLDAGVKFMPVLGNHDTLFGHRQAEITFFQMPGSYYDFIQGDAHFFALDTTHFDTQERQWLIAALARAKEPWKIVYAHNPIFSSGMHGSNGVLQKKLEPILEQYHVNLYLAGHDHGYERIAPKHGVYYFVSGGGGASLRPFILHAKGSLVRKKVHHFLRITLQEKTFSFQAIDDHGQVIDSGVLPAVGS